MSHLKRKLEEVEGDSGATESKEKHIKQSSSQSLLERLQYPDIGIQKPSKAPPFQYPFQLVSFSYTPERILEFTNGALRYYVDPPLGADLTYRIDNWIRRAEERGRLDGLLKACLHEQAVQERRRASVVSWRGVMTKILTAPYEVRDEWELNVMSVKGVLYFEEHTSEKKLQDKEKSMTGNNRLQSYMGYAFESYCSSSVLNPSEDHSRLSNGWSGDVDTNVQWCSVVKTKLGDYRLLIGGEVDCVRGKYTGQPKNFVELKTSMSIRHQGDEVRFEQKLLKFYFQSFLLGVPEIIVGFRTRDGRLTTFQTFKTMELPRLVRGKPHAWDPNLCLEWGHRCIRLLEKTIKSFTTTDLENPQVDSQVWRVKFKPKYGIEIHLLDDDGVREVVNGEDRVGFLPKWYWEDVSKLPSVIPESTHANASTSKHPLDIEERQKPDGEVKASGWVI